jgi:glycosyltransferase involved in cell wall biosynthesis
METPGGLLENPLPLVAKWKKAANEVVICKPTRKTEITPIRTISVIIPAHNEERYLRRTLDALKRQDYDWFEIIVVANGCTDCTAEVAKGRCNRLITLSQKSLGVSRNLGARLAKGELLLFLDADTVLEPGALRSIAEEFSKNHSAGTLKGRPDTERFKYRMVYGLKNFVHRYSLHRGSSGVILCWKMYFIHVGGFDERLEVRENSELMRRLRRFGKYKYISDVSAVTSMRRYDRQGCRRVVWLWVKLWFRSIFGDLHNRHYETVR